jgi:hypothetical protein
MTTKAKVNVMICTPFAGLSDDEIEFNIHKTASKLTDIVLDLFKDNEDGYNELEVHFFSNNINYQRPMIPCDTDTMEDYRLMCLGNGISNIMAECDAVVFANKWYESHGCMIEMISALMYHKPIVALDEEGNPITRDHMMDIVKDSINDMLNNV